MDFFWERVLGKTVGMAVYIRVTVNKSMEVYFEAKYIYLFISNGIIPITTTDAFQREVNHKIVLRVNKNSM